MIVRCKMVIMKSKFLRQKVLVLQVWGSDLLNGREALTAPEEANKSALHCLRHVLLVTVVISALERQ